MVLVGLTLLAVCAGHACAAETTFAPLLPSDIELSADEDASTFHDLAFDGTAYLAVWPSREQGRAGIQGQFIGTDGAKGSSFLIPDGNGATHPRIARSCEGFLVVYTASDGIFGSVVGAGGGPGTAFPICTAANTQDYPAVIAGGPNLLVVWQDYRAYTSTGIDIYGRLVSPSGSLIGGEFRIGPSSGNQRNPIGSFNGQDYVVVWTQGGADPTDEDLYGARIAPDGTVRDPEGFPICAAGGSRATLSADCTVGPNGETALAWTDTRTSPTSLYWTTVSREGAVLDGTPALSGRLVFRDSSYPPGNPSILYNGREYVVFFTSHSKVIAALIGPDGTVRLPQRVPVVYGSSPARTACAYDGANYLVSYATTGAGQVFAQLVTDANRLPIAEAGPGSTFEAVRGTGLMDGGLSTDPDGDLPLTYYWKIISKPATSSPSLSGQWTQAASLKASAPGEYIVELIVTDAHGAVGLPDQLAFTVTPFTNRAPALDPIGPRSVNALQPLVIQLSGSDPDGDPVSFGVSSPPANSVFDSSTATFSWTPTASQVKTYYVQFWIRDIAPTYTKETVRIDVLDPNRPPVLTPIGDRTVDEGELLEIVLSATDADGNALTFSATGIPADAFFDTAAGRFTWTPTYAQAGDYPITLSVSDGIDSDTEDIVVHVVDRDITPPTITVPTAPVPDADGNVVVGVEDAVSATYSINSGSEGSLTPQEGSITVPVPIAPGAYSITVRATDAAGNTATSRFTVTVADTADPVITTSTNTDTVPAGGFVVSATDNSGTPTVAYAVSVGGQTVASGSEPGSITISPDVFEHTGVYAVTITATDAARNQATSTFTVSVDATAPVTGTLAAAPNPAPITTAITVTADVDDTGAFSCGIASADVSLDGGDWASMSVGDTAFGGVTEQVTFTLPAFATAGVHSIRVRATDAAGNVAGGSEPLLIAVYDPSAGFVTGGGWIASPAGAYTANPSMTGKSTFGFVAKYQKGANVPTGETEFQFKTGDLNFHSETYDWLVVAGAKAQFKGIGTINGRGDYGFMLTAVDGAINGRGGTDTFRIKIWDRASDAVVYDNQVGASDTADPMTVIGSGSIIIHATK